VPATGPRPTKEQRRDESRARAAELRAQQERAARRARVIVVVVSALAVVGLVAAVALTIANSRATARANTDIAWAGGADTAVRPALADTAAPSTADETGGIPVSDEGVGVAGAGDVTVSVYFDPQCPGCRQFDAVNADDLAALATEPGITVVYQPLVFLDPQSLGTYYSSRAGNALMVVADRAPEQFEAFLTAMFAQQPEENTSGRTDDEIAAVATSVGVPDDVIAHFTDTVDGTYRLQDSDEDLTGTWRTFTPFLAAATELAGTTFGAFSTPLILIDGEQVGNDSSADDYGFYFQAGALAERVRALAAEG
jgi:protein-disulfide isomerase